MMTIVTHVTLKEGTEPDWDIVMRERMQAARDQPGWIGGQLLIPLDGPNRRVIIRHRGPHVITITDARTIRGARRRRA